MTYHLLKCLIILSILFTSLPSQLYADTSNRVAIIVNKHLFPKINLALNTYTQDLKNEGYLPIIHTWSLEQNPDPKSLKAYLQNLYRSPEGLQGALFVGDLPIVFFEPTLGNNAKNHPYTHQETFLTDKFYMDLEGPEWEDSDNNGYYDKPVFQNGVRTYLEIWVSRLSASNLKHFNGLNEWDLINKYFEKNHDFRVGNTSYSPWNLLYIQDDHADERKNFGNIHYYNAFDPEHTISILRGTASNEFVHLLDSCDYEYATWVLHGHPQLLAFDKCDYNHLPKWHYDNINTCNGYYGYITSKYIAGINASLGGLFTVPCSCWVGKYNEANYIMGTFLFKPESRTLSMISATIPIIDYPQNFFLESMNNGENFGNSYLKLANEWTPRFVRALLIERSKVLFGDGTLKRQKFMAERKPNAKRLGNPDNFLLSPSLRERITPTAKISLNMNNFTILWPKLHIPGIQYEIYVNTLNDPNTAELIYKGEQNTCQDTTMQLGNYYWLKYSWNDGINSKFSEFPWRAFPNIYGIMGDPLLASQQLELNGNTLIVHPVEKELDGGKYQVYRFTMKNDAAVLDKVFDLEHPGEFIDHDARQTSREFFYMTTYSVLNPENKDLLILNKSNIESIKYE